jgi:DNA-binding NarL/FixJ family response regulator
VVFGFMVQAAHPLKIRIALVEDDPSFRHALHLAVADCADLDLVAVGFSRAEGLAMLKLPPADVLICDLGLPDGSGIDVIAKAQLEWPHCAVMVATMFGDEAHVISSIEAGVAHHIADEIRSLHAGGSPISPLIARQVLRRFRHAESATLVAGVESTASVPADATNKSPLSAREHQTLDYITKGFTMDEIASLQGVSPHTVKNFVRRIYAKLEVNSKTEAIFEARQRGLIQ